MFYTLPDGRVIDLSNVSEVLPIKDFGKDPQSIDKRRLGFSIYLNKDEVLDVIDYYHFNDWAKVKKSLQKIRTEIMEKWHHSDRVE